MSWSVPTIRVAEGDDVAEVLDAATLEARAKLDVDAALQVQAATAAVVALVESGQLGQSPYAVTLWGHCSPGHIDHAGWAADSVGITVTRLRRSPAPFVATCGSCGRGINAGDPLCCSTPRTVNHEARS
ncbi:hypothetical protein ACK8HX_02130 [Oryzobacter sp. R7]|uniref:hypothetical protein n=1 Tax=Oryzobacter faecalis TaxID=3388656 RepID=UPI00398CF311